MSGHGPFSHWRRLSWPARLLAIPIYVYRVAISPLLPRSCRFEPSCSSYALEALARHGVLHGALLTARRLSRCHPFERFGGGSGYDPVPETRGARAETRGERDKAAERAETTERDEREPE